MNPDKLLEILTDAFGDNEVRRGQFKINCFNPACGDTTKNLEISLEKQIFHCWKCGYSGNITKLLRDYLGYVPKVEEYVKAQDLTHFQIDFNKEVIEKPNFRGLPAEFCPLWDNRTLSMIGQKALKYALTRMTQEDLVKYKVGYCGLGSYRWRIIIPVFEGGNVIYWVARSIYQNDGMPYMYPGFVREDVVFNIDRARELGRAVIVEGILDAIWVGDDGVAILSTDLLPPQFAKLIDIPDITVMLDAGEMEKQKTLKIAKQFKSYGKIIKLVILPSGDPDNWPKEEIRRRIKEALLFNIQLEFQLSGL